MGTGYPPVGIYRLNDLLIVADMYDEFAPANQTLMDKSLPDELRIIFQM